MIAFNRPFPVVFHGKDSQNRLYRRLLSDWEWGLIRRFYKCSRWFYCLWNDRHLTGKRARGRRRRVRIYIFLIRIASRVFLATVVCTSICLSICPSEWTLRSPKLWKLETTLMSTNSHNECVNVLYQWKLKLVLNFN